MFAGTNSTDIPARCWHHRLKLVLVTCGFACVVLLATWTSHRKDSSILDDRQLLRTEELSNSSLLQAPATPRRFQCIGWRATRRCSPDGPRDLQNDKDCSEIIDNSMSGYCEIEDLDTGERLQVMRRHCDVLQRNVSFRCSQAPFFANYHVEAQAVTEKALVENFTLPHVTLDGRASRDGIVMVVYPKLLVSAYATIRVLREVLKCRLPIEVWFHVDEIMGDYTLLKPLQQLAMFVGRISFHPIYNPRAEGFLSKIFAIYNSYFDRVLFLDADNVPVRDPSFLFKSSEFEATGAVFWPDLWHPQRTLFNVRARSMLWELLDIPFVDMFEQENGQLLVDRSRHAAPLELVYFYAFHEPNYFESLQLVHGDKDLFRLAWIKSGATYHMMEALPALAGKDVDGSFCGMTMVQHDAEGNILFLHRDQHKLTGERGNTGNRDFNGSESQLVEDEDVPPDSYPDPIIWTHLLSFSKDANRSFYLIDAYRASPQFPQRQLCYGRRFETERQHFELQEFSSFSFAGIETDLRHFAKEAADLQRELHPVRGGEVFVGDP